MRVTGIGFAAVACLSATLLAGCSGTVSGTAEKAKPSAKSGDLFDPCTQLSDDVLRQVGLDPSTKEVVTDAPSGPVDARVCQWDTTAQHDLNVGILSETHTLDEVRKNRELADFKDTTVGSRKAIQSRQITPHSDPNCGISMAAEQGIFEIDVAWPSRLGAPPADLCDEAIRFATALGPHLPK